MATNGTTTASDPHGVPAGGLAVIGQPIASDYSNPGAQTIPRGQQRLQSYATGSKSGCGPLPFAAPSLPLRHSPSHRRSILEPAGALAIAGVKQWAAAANTRDQTYVAITSGANMNFDSLRFVSERADASETLLSVVIPERPGET